MAKNSEKPTLILAPDDYSALVINFFFLPFLDKTQYKDTRVFIAVVKPDLSFNLTVEVNCGGR